MKSAFKSWAFILLLGLIALSIWKASTLLPAPSASPSISHSPTPSATTEISGCYVNHNDENRYVLNIDSVDENQFTAFVGYYNKGFDSSSGEYVGSFSGQILDGIYSFVAEGTDNRRELVFKYVDGNFIAGFGEYKMVNGTELLVSLHSVKWMEKYTYSPAEDCSAP
jgi:hypothetical protein